MGSVRNPWGRVPMTDSGRHLTGRSREYADRLSAQRRAPDTVSRRHHYVPKAYLRQWSSDEKRIWSLNTQSGTSRLLGIADVCVEEDFYRVVGSDGNAHNRVELLFGVIDSELRRVQLLLDSLTNPDDLEFDDLIGLGISMAAQRMRTLQERRLMMQNSRWLAAQNPRDLRAIEGGAADPFRLAGVHTRTLFEGMWHAADVLTTRQIEIWEDPHSRFLTCDAPVILPFVEGVRPSLVSSPHVIWPISPRRAVVLTNELEGEKAVIRVASGKMVGAVTQGVERGRERMIFAADHSRSRLGVGKIFARRAQLRLRCADHTPRGEYVPPPGCCVEQSHTFAVQPDIRLCHQGLHRPTPVMSDLC